MHLISVFVVETGIGPAPVEIRQETVPPMSRLVHATTVTFLHPDPTGPVYEYNSIRCTPGHPGTETVILEVPETAHAVSEHGHQHPPPIANGWEAIVSNSDGEILVDGHVIRSHEGWSASVYTLRRER